MRKQFFIPVTGKGLGVTYSSYTQIGKIFPQAGFGQAGLNVFTNLMTGNAVVFDRAVRVKETNFPIEFQFIYNSLASNKNWRFGLKRFVSLPATNSPRGPAAILEEADGHLTTYTSSDGSIVYSAETHGDGTPLLRYDYANNHWIWRDPKTQIVEIYDTNGLLIQRMDERLRATTYGYTNGELSSVTGPSGVTYSIIRENTLDGQIIYIKAGTELIHTYVLDKLGRLCKSITPDPNAYTTTYTYGGESSVLIDKILQDDGSEINLGFDYSGDQSLNYLGLGGADSSNRCDFGYDRATSVGWVEDADRSRTTMTYNKNGSTTQVQSKTGFALLNSPDKIIQYGYTDQNQLETITDADSGMQTFSYDPYFGFITEHMAPDGQISEKYYQGDNEITRLICETKYLDANKKNPITTRYVYDQSNGNTFLRFKITQEGRVTEYRPTADGLQNIKSKREYINLFYPNINNWDTRAAPSLDEVLAVLANPQYVNPQDIMLTEYSYDSYGQIAYIYRYTDVDAQGNGIQNESMGSEWNIQNRYGSLQRQQIKKSDTENQITRQVFDGLQRVQIKQNALKEETRYDYSRVDNVSAPYQLKITRPNQSVEIKSFDGQGFTTTDALTAAGAAVSRTTDYQRDTMGRPIVVTRPDQQKDYQFYDRANRLAYTVSALGIVKAFQYNTKPHYHAQIAYDSPVDVSKIIARNPEFVPTADRLIKLLPSIQNPAKDRVSYTFFDLTGLKQFEVDAKKYITEYIYDNLNRKIGKIRFSTQISDAQLNSLKMSGKVSLPTPDFTKDRATRIFYDKDNLVIAKQDEGGFITQFQRDGAGRIVQKTLYHTPIPIDFSQDFKAVIAAVSAFNDPKDAHTRYAYDARGQLIAELNAENYLTRHEYFSNGRRKHSILYANKPTAEFPTPPLSSPQDKMVLLDYDLLERQTQRQNSEGLQALEAYDVMGNAILHREHDLLTPGNLAADFDRNTQAQYDGWNQLSKEANPFVGALLAAAKTPDEIQKIWDTLSTRYVYDNSGLKLSATDSLGQTTYFYYDLDRRPILSIDPRGSLTELTLNSFGEEIQKRRYKTALILTPQITGGLMTAEFRAQLNQLQSPVDSVEIKERDQRGQIEKEMDANKNTTTRVFNAYQEVAQANLPVATQDPSLQINYEHDPRGLVTKTTKTADGVSITTSAEYKNPLGKCTQTKDGEGNTTKQVHDRLGQVTQQIDANENTAHTFERDMLGRVTIDSDALQQKTKHAYDQVTRQEMITSPDQKSTKTLTHNVFKEVAFSQDSLGNMSGWTHAPNASVQTHTDALGDTEKTDYDLIGQKKSQEDYERILTSFGHDASGNLDKTVEDANGAKRTNSKVFDPKNLAVNERDPNNILTENTFDPAGLLIQKIKDKGNASDSLNITTKNQFNGQHALAYTVKGDANNANQADQQNKYDGFGRQIASIVDPNGLKLTQWSRFNKADRKTVVIDPNGHATFTFYDGVGNKRFEITALGGVTEWRYNANNKQELIIQYENKIDTETFNEETPLSAVIALLPAQLGSMDSFTRFVYDENSQLRFEINSVGATKEYIYNLNLKRVAEIKHDLPIAGNDFFTLTYAEACQGFENKTEPTEFDRASYWVLDAKNRERFLIDPEGYVTEKRYDKNGLEIQLIRYATRVQNPRTVAALPVGQVLSQVTLNKERDRYQYTFYTALKQPQFVVTPKGDVTKFEYDAAGNLEKVIEFEKRATVPADYDSVRAEISAWVSDPTKDRIYVKKYDHANRLTDDFDPLNNKEHFTWDALNNQLSRTDRGNFLWQTVYDRASRPVQTIQPEAEIALVTIENSALSVSTQTLKLIKKTSYDNNGNKTEIISAQNAPGQERSVEFFYNACNSHTGVSIENVDIDDPTLPGDLTKFPLKNVTITTEVVLNAKQLVVAERNLSVEGQGPQPWAFKVYDQAKRLVFKVNANGIVSGYGRNRFGEIISATVYDTALTLDLSKYTSTGIPLEDVLGNLKTSPDDRTTHYEYDRKGNRTLVRKDEIYYHVCTGPSTHNPSQLKKESPLTRTEYDAFSKPVSVSALIDADADSWQEDLYWYDKNGNLKIKASYATEKEGYYVVCQKNNRDGKVTDKTEFANPCKAALTPDFSAKTLIALMKGNPDPNDRRLENEYDLRGDLVKETRVGVKRQNVAWTVVGTPPVFTAGTVNITTRYEYDSRQFRVVTTRTDDLASFSFFNAVGKKIAETGIPYYDAAPNHEPVLITPLIYYYYNANNELAGETRFLLGTKNVSKDQIPLPIDANNPGDLITLYLKDNRGLTRVKQSPRSATPDDPLDPNRNPKAGWEVYTQTPSKKTARKIYPFSNAIDFTTFQANTDQLRFVFDVLDRRVSKTIFRTEPKSAPYIVEQTQNRFSSFDEVTGEGEGNDTFPLVRVFDKTGQEIYTNKPSPSISLRDLRGKSSFSVTSGSENLSKIDLNNLPPEIIASQTDFVYDRTEQQYDNRGYRTGKFMPATVSGTSGSGGNFLSYVVLVSDGYEGLFPQGTPCLTWAMPQLAIVPTFYIDVEPPIKLDLAHNATRCGVNLSTIPGGVLNYFINFGYDEKEPLFKVSGTVEVLNSHVPQGAYAYELLNQNQLKFDNNNSTLTSIALKLGNKVVANIPVTQGLQNIDLSRHESGTYTLSDGSKDSLPITIYTKVPNTTVLSWEIPFELFLFSSNNYGEVIWKVPPLFSSNNLKITCDYKDWLGQSYSEEFEVSPSNPVINFSNIVNEMVAVTASLKNFDNTWIPLLQKMAPDDQSYMGGMGTSNFKLRDFCYVSPFAGIDPTKDSVSYRDLNGGLTSKWVQFKTVISGTAGFTADITGLPSGIYPFQVKTPTAPPSPVNMTNIFVVQSKTTPGTFYTSKDYLKASTSASRAVELVKKRRNSALSKEEAEAFSGTVFRPGILSELDHWGNELTHVETGAGNNALVTKKEFNDRNVVVKKTEPRVTFYFTEDGKAGESDSASPVTQTMVNDLDQVIGSIDPNGNARAQMLNKRGDVIVDVMPDGYVSSRRRYDGFGRMITYWDSQGNPWYQVFNNSNRIIEMKKPSGSTVKNLYNERNILLRQTSPEKHIYAYGYSAKEDMVFRMAPTGAVTRMAHNHLHQLTEYYYPSDPHPGYSGSLFWNFDYLGNPSTDKPAHIDLAGTPYFYKLDFRNRPVHIGAETSENHGQSAVMYEIEFINGNGQVGYGVAIQDAPMPDKSVTYSYAGDSLMQISNAGTGKITTYSYTDFLQPYTTELRDMATGSVLHFSQTTYDGLQRPIWIVDGRFSLNIGYDLASNRVMSSATVQADPWSSGASAVLWNKPDSCGRMIIDGGVLDGKTIKFIPDQGVENVYINNLKRKEKFSDALGTHTVTLDYDKDRVFFGTQDDVSLLTTTRGYSLDLDLLTYDQDAPHAGINEVKSASIVNTYSNQQLIESDSTVVTVTGDGPSSTVTKSSFDNATTDVIMSQHSSIVKDNTGTVEDTKNSYVGFEGLLPSYSVGTVYTKFASALPEQLNRPLSLLKTNKVSYGISRQAYNADGYMLAVFNGQGKMPYSDKTYSVRSFLNLADGGRILDSTKILSSKPLSDSALTSLDDDQIFVLKDFYFADQRGQVLGSYLEDLTTGQQTPSVNFGRYGVNAKGGCALGFNANRSSWSYTDGRNQFFLADFDAPVGAHWTMMQHAPGGKHSWMYGALCSATPNWDAIDVMQPTYPPVAAQNYAVKEGDTLPSIGQQFFSSAKYGADIGLNNGLGISGDQSQLIPGQEIRLPQFMPMTNSVGNNIPYQYFVTTMQGHLSPYVTIQQHESFWELVVGIVAVVVAVAAAPYLAPQIFATAAPLVISLVAAGTAGVLDFVGQELLVDAGYEKNVSWTDVVGAMISAAAGVKNGLLSSFQTSSNAAIDAAIKAGTVNVTAQVAELATGGITSFDPKQILASMVGAGLGQFMFPQTGSEFNWGQVERDAANSVMDGFIKGTIDEQGINAGNMFAQFVESGAEDALTTGRNAISQASAQKAQTQPALAKIPAPADTGTAWENTGRAAQQKAAANDDRWRSTGAVAINQRAQTSTFMLNQMTQAAAQSSALVTGDDLFKMYAAHTGVDVDDLISASQSSGINANNISWRNAGRVNVGSQNTGFFGTLGRDFTAVASTVTGTASRAMTDILHPSQLRDDVVMGLYEHQNNSLVHALIEGDFAMERAFDSSAGQILLDGFDATAKGMDPFITGYRAMYGVDPMTGASASRMQGLFATGLNLLPAAGDLASSGARLAGATWGKLLGDEALILDAGKIADSTKAKIGQKVYRVWGDEAKPFGLSWTRENPDSIDNYRDKAGLPDLNTGRFVIEGRLKDITNVSTRSAIPLDGNTGGIDEVLIPDPEEQIDIEKISGVNPNF